MINVFFTLAISQVVCDGMYLWADKKTLTVFYVNLRGDTSAWRGHLSWWTIFQRNEDKCVPQIQPTLYPDSTLHCTTALHEKTPPTHTWQPPTYTPIHSHTKPHTSCGHKTNRGDDFTRFKQPSKMMYSPYGSHIRFEYFYTGRGDRLTANNLQTAGNSKITYPCGRLIPHIKLNNA